MSAVTFPGVRRQMKEIIKKLINSEIEDAVIQVHVARQALYDSLDAVKQKEVLVAGQVAVERGRSGPAFPNEDVRRAETAMRLRRDAEYQRLQQKLQDARANLALAEAALERERSAHSGLVAAVNLLSAKAQAGRDTSGLKDEIARALGIGSDKSDSNGQSAQASKAPAVSTDNTTDAGTENSQTQDNEDGLETGTFTILEVRDGKSPGTVRAWCEGPEGKVAVYAKNGVGQILRNSLHRQVEAKYRRGNKGLIAFNVRLAG